MALTKNQLAELTVTGVTGEGFGVARYTDEDIPAPGLVVFIPQTAIGDRLVCRIVKVQKSHAFGRVEELLTPSPDRCADPECTAYGRCGGCNWRHITYEAECGYKQNWVEDTLRRVGGITAPVLPLKGGDSPDRYRNKAQFPVAPGVDGPLIGFFAPRSHRIIPCRDCKLQPAGYAAVLGAVEDWMRAVGISAYDEEAHTGLVRHVYIRQAAVTGEMMVCLVCTRGEIPQPDVLIEKLTSAAPALVSLWVNVNPDRTNVILGEKGYTLWGTDAIVDELCGLRFRLSPHSFYQVNHAQTEKLYRLAAQAAELTGKETLLDLYCGTGTIGLSMAHCAGAVIGVEVVEAAVRDARRNAKANHIRNARFICADAAKAARQLAREGIRPEVVVLDPPRKGCSPDLIATVVEMAPDRVVYVSCDPATLARDLKMFGEQGYETRWVQPVDLFPRTAHCENVVLLSREKVVKEDNTALCDMHIHSNCSDGSFSPEELIAEAKKEGIKAIALCDHNTVSGLTRFVNAAKNSEVLAVAGVEVTSVYKGKEVHILGLFLKENQYPKIAEYLELINIRKTKNNKLLAKRLNEGGFAINYDAVLNIAGDAIPNRVHFAKALLMQGYVSSVSEAFETILSENGKFYKPAEKLESLEVIRFLRSVAAVPVLAHPFLNFSLDELRGFLPKAKKCGLVGMETIYPLFSREETALAESLAKEYGLIPSGGSDFHGINKPDIKIGRGKNNIAVPYRFYENLKKSV